MIYIFNMEQRNFMNIDKVMKEGYDYLKACEYAEIMSEFTETELIDMGFINEI